MGTFEVQGPLWQVLNDGHVHRQLKRMGMRPLVDEALAQCALSASWGHHVKLHNVHGGWGSWALTLDGETVHLRTQAEAGVFAPKFDGTIYLRDRYQRGSVVGQWATVHDVRRWFAHARERGDARRRAA